MINTRQEKILELLKKNGEVQLKNLRTLFPGVSMMTLRRDLIVFEREGILIRTYGGGISVKKITDGQTQAGEEDAYSSRALENIHAKEFIAGKALACMEKGRSIYFDAGSTIMHLARTLNDENYSIITSGANIAVELVKKNKVSVVLLGGLLNKNTLSVSGPMALSFLETINIDLAFMAASGFSLESGFTVSSIYENELKHKIVERARKTIMLMDTSKINKNMPFTFARLADIDVWIAETELPEQIKAEALKHKVQLL